VQNNFHKDFQLNGLSFSSVDELLAYALNFSKEIHQFLEKWFSDSDFMIVQTSGSTGAPKELQLSKKSMLNSALATGKYFNLQEKTSALLCLPTAYIAGKMMLIRALALGWHLDVIASSSDPLENIEKEYDFSAMVPLQLENAILKLDKIKKMIVGGGVVSTQLKQKLEAVSTQVFATYGMTETATHIAVKRLNHSLASKARLGDFYTSYYQTLPNVTIYKDQRNCLVINAQCVSKEIIFTNDVVNLISDTQFEWLGRVDNVINSGSIKLHPEKIEEKLSKIMKQRFFVAGIPDKKLGERLVLFLELESAKVSKFKTLIEAEIKNLESLSKFEIPKEIYFLDAFIDTETKKIQRKKTIDLI
jgi:O-succinylbenzoic acid--CoA ligase